MTKSCTSSRLICGFFHDGLNPGAGSRALERRLGRRLRRIGLAERDIG